MALNLEDPEVDHLASELAATTGESLSEAVLQALRERLAREKNRRRTPRLRDEIRAIRERCAKLPILDTRSPEEILGYDETGTPR